jgi:hypothetical protein
MNATPSAQIQADLSALTPGNAEPDLGASGARTPALSGQSSSARSRPGFNRSSSARTFPANKPSVGFLGISQGRSWRPKVYVRNPNYPRVTAVGCFFVEHSGGYQLIHTKSNKYLGHYSMAAIAELEKKYAKKKRISRSRKRK